MRIEIAGELTHPARLTDRPRSVPRNQNAPKPPERQAAELDWQALTAGTESQRGGGALPPPRRRCQRGGDGGTVTAFKVRTFSTETQGSGPGAQTLCVGVWGPGF